ncbi:MAG TPA: Gfo/Idh/MocA family oxidoreductase [Firmicutes bacterium]|nr:Gfo/Idh/MocA family oxidoreductase [Bacillota bacterium]
MSQELRVGVLGAGMIANAHMKGYEIIPAVKVVAVSDVLTERAQDFARRYNIPRVYGDYRELLEATDIDAVSVCLPVFMHAPATIDALEAGKHVLCEKPMALNAQEAQEMVDTAEKTGKKLMVYWRRRFSPEARRAKEIIDSGELGNIYYCKTIRYRFRGRPGFDATMQNFGRWFMDKDKAGGGALMDIGGYDLDVTLGLIGFPAIGAVSCSTYQEIDKEKAAAKGVSVEELALGFIRTVTGVTVWLETAFAINGPQQNETFFFGSEGGLSLSPLKIYKPVWYCGKEPIAIEPDIPAQYPTAQECFVDSVMNDKPIPISSGKEALYIAKLQDALYESARSGREIKLQ